MRSTDDLVVKVFYVSHVEAQELSQMVSTIMRVPQMAVQPTLMANKTANTITVRATAAVVDIIERIIRSNDKPRAEVLIDVQILEVNRNRAKQFGLNLNAYALGLHLLARSIATEHELDRQRQPPPSPPPFNLNTISQGISTADFYMSVPTAQVKFLETDSHTKTIAKPQLRGAEGQKLTLNLGDDIPVLSTVFGAAALGRIRQYSAVIVQLPLRRRDSGGDATGHLRRRDHSRAAGGEQYARRLRSRSPGSRYPRSDRARSRRSCAFAKVSPTFWLACSASGTARICAGSRDCCVFRSSSNSSRTTISRSSRRTSSCS